MKLLWQSSCQRPLQGCCCHAFKDGQSPGSFYRQGRQRVFRPIKRRVSGQRMPGRASGARAAGSPANPVSTAQGRDIRLIATDVDGTLLDSRQQLSQRTERTLKKAMARGVQVVVATGKALGPWIDEILPRLDLPTPGVFMQGLLICNPDKSIRFERAMELDVARAVIALAKTEGVTLTAYSGDRILCEETDYHTDRLLDYGEPPPEPVGTLDGIVDRITIHKFIYMADPVRIPDLRRRIDAEFAGRATVVTALPGMVEVLPLGASKGSGLAMVLEDLGVSPEHVMAVGDGENDIEMIRMAGLGIAMGNAGEDVKAVADYVTATNNEDGLALAVERWVLGGVPTVAV